MATDLFKKYYNNPSKSYIYSTMQCNSEDEGLSFDINGSAGEISDNSNVISSIDLSEIHVPMTQYAMNRSVIEPHSYIYVKGGYYGDVYTEKAYGKIPCEIKKTDNWEENSILFFVIKYKDVDTGRAVIKSIKASGVAGEKTFCETVNAYFTETNVPVEVSLTDDYYVVFKSTKIGYDFWIDHVMMWLVSTDADIINAVNDWITSHGYSYKYGWNDDFVECQGIETDNIYTSTNVFSSVLTTADYSRLYNMHKCLSTDFNDLLEENDVKKVHLFEDLSRGVAPRKYRNGAMIGTFLVATYPEYNDSDVPETSKTLLVGHLANRIQEFKVIPDSIYRGTIAAVRNIVDVVDNYHSEYDTEMYNKWLNIYSHINTADFWFDSDEVPQPTQEMFDKWAYDKYKHYVPASEEGEGEWIMSKVDMLDQAESIYKDIETRDAMGLDGYCAYLSQSGGWIKIGQMYGRSGIADDPDNPYVSNMIPSYIVFNPNDYPVIVNYMIFG